VIDENARPVTFAQVEVRPSARRVVADNRGEFVISGLDAGNHELHVKRIGYQPAVVPITLPRQEPLVITLGSIPRLLDSVRIQARGPVARYTGVVLDDAEQPVADAEVIAAGASDLNVRTDAQGHFRLLKAQKGTLMLRVRKFGYTPYFGSLRLMTERIDTIRVKRLAQDLPQAYILAESGFGRDSLAYIELDSRMRWKLSSAAVTSREELDAWSGLNLCMALMRLPAAGRMRLRESDCNIPRCILVDGVRPIVRPLNAFLASEVEAFEFHEKDWSTTLSQRVGLFCDRRANAARDGGGTVIWMRK
jgi:hypothetical protein